MSRRGVVPVLLWAGLSATTWAGEGIPWSRDTTAAFAQASDRRSPVLILFTGPNCGPKARPGSISGGGAETRDLRDKCELLEEDVLSKPDVVEAAGRFVPLLSELSLVPRADELSLENRYRVVSLPTVLLADPWGNEIIRLVGTVPRDKFLGVLEVMPADFSPLEPTGKRMRADPDDAQALVAAAAFYRQLALLPVSESLYEKAMGAKGLDAAARRETAIARGTILMQLGRPRNAAKLFEKTLAEAPDGPMSDALLFGWMMAELHAGRIKEARKVQGDLERRFPASPYAAKGRQNLDAAATPKP